MFVRPWFQLVCSCMLGAQVVGGCSSSPRPKRVSSPSGSGVRCGRTPTMIVDGASYVDPDKPAAVQVPFIMVSSDHLFYFINLVDLPNAGANNTGRLMRIGFGGGAPEELALVPGGNSAGQPFALTPDGVVYAEQHGENDRPGLTLVSAPGGEHTPVVSTDGLAHAVLGVGTELYFLDDAGLEGVSMHGGTAHHLADTRAFGLGATDGTVLVMTQAGLLGVPTDGGPATTLAPNASGLDPIGCGSGVCWVESNGRLARKDPNRDPVTLAMSLALFEPHALVFDGTDFFVSAGGGGGALYRIPATGGDPILVAIGPGLSSIAADDSCIYWSTIQGIFSLRLDTADAADGGI